METRICNISPIRVLNLLSLEQFLYRLMNEPDYVFNAASGLCKVTVYANEYFYEQNPMQENAPKDKKFVENLCQLPGS